jgi:phosphohistidine phosphatase
MIYLVHHADALPPEVDAQRPLSSAGRASADRLAQEAAAGGVKPVAIWHSGKLRARQTADAFLRECNPLAEFSAIRGLQPGDPPEWIRDFVAGETRDLMFVGHMPHLPRLYALLVGGSDPRRVEFTLHGLVGLEPAGPLWAERMRLQPVRI